MKPAGDFPKLEPRTAALLSCLAIGLALAVHGMFFVFAALIVLGGPIASGLRWMRQHLTSPNPQVSRGNSPIARRPRTRSMAVVVAALVIGFLVIPGRSVFSGDRSDSAQSKPLLAVSGPAKLGKTSTEIERARADRFLRLFHERPRLRQGAGQTVWIEAGAAQFGRSAILLHE